MNHATTENVRTPRAPHSNTPNTFVSGWNPNPKFKKKKPTTKTNVKTKRF